MGRRFSLLTSTALTTSTALLSGAMAADMRLPTKAPPLAAPAFSWAGCYIGANGGVASVSISQRNTVPGFETDATKGRDLGGTAGAQIGCNYQYSPSFVLGIEGDINFVDVGRRKRFDLDTANEDITGTHATRLHWLATVRGRLGFVADRTLFFVTGGLAVGEVKTRVNAVEEETSDVYRKSDNGTRTGWTAGFGVEHAFTNKISIKAEYLHFDLGRERFNVSVGLLASDVLRISSRVSGDIVRIGVNFKLN